MIVEKSIECELKKFSEHRDPEFCLWYALYVSRDKDNFAFFESHYCAQQGLLLFLQVLFFGKKKRDE